ncbi:MAG: hypothetical protein P8I62_04310, partial [Pseudomonadales bacterium]|nr:hypothetical protein [Pseudomonadales bacterium]
MTTMTVDSNTSPQSSQEASQPAADVSSNGLDSSRDYRQTVGKIEVANTKMSMRDVNVSYGDKQAVFGVDLDIA